MDSAHSFLPSEEPEVRIIVRGAFARVIHGRVSIVDRATAVKDKNAWYSSAYKCGAWDGYHRFVNNRKGTFPAGLINRVTDYCKKRGIRFDVNGPEGIRDRIAEDVLIGVTLRDYQRAAVDSLLRSARGTCRCPTACHREGQLILMFNGKLKRVEDVHVGDLLMGPDSSHRRVLSLCRGDEQMVEIIPKQGESFVVNLSHVLTLRNIDEKSPMYWNLIDVPVRDYLEWSKTAKWVHKMIRVGVNFAPKRKLPLDPYFVGLYLGDGAMEVSLRHRNQGRRSRSDTPINPVRKKLVDMGVMGPLCEDRFIPFEYLTASRKDRIRLLAGLIDSDGSLASGYYDFLSKSKRLTEDVAYLARSLGFAAYISSQKKYDQNGHGGVYYRLGISGEISRIPCKVKRNGAPARRQKKDVRHLGFSTRLLGVEPYFGFTVDGDGRYLLGDFTVTHNSGKTEIFAAVCQTMIMRDISPILILVPKKGLLHQTAERIKTRLGESVKVGMLGDGFREWKGRDVVVATPQTLWSMMKQKRADVVEWVRHGVKVIVFDECQHTSSVTWFKIAKKCQANWRFAFSGTPLKDSELEDRRMEAAVGPIVYSITPAELIERGILARPVVYFIRDDTVFGPPGHSRIWQEAIRNFLVDNKKYNRTIAILASKLCSAKVAPLILCTQIRHVRNIAHEMARRGAPYSVLIGQTAVAVRKGKVKAFEAAQDRAIIATSIFDEGENIPTLQAVVLAGGGKSHVNLMQRIGRGMRKKVGRNEVLIFDFAHSNFAYGLRHSRSRYRQFKKEGFDVIDVRDFDNFIRNSEFGGHKRGGKDTGRKPVPGLLREGGA